MSSCVAAVVTAGCTGTKKAALDRYREPGLRSERQTHRPAGEWQDQDGGEEQTQGGVADYEDGLATAPTNYTVADAVNDWLTLGRPDSDPPQPPHIAVWRSVRRGGDTKTRKSRRTLALPARCVEGLWQQFEDQGWERLAAGDNWEEHGLVFSSAVGKPLDATNVRRAFRQALKEADGINADDWTPRELRHSFVSLLSDRGVPLEEIVSSATPARP